MSSAPTSKKQSLVSKKNDKDHLAENEAQASKRIRTDQHTLIVARVYISKSKTDVHAPRASKIDAMNRMNEALKEQEEVSKARKENREKKLADAETKEKQEKRRMKKKEAVEKIKSGDKYASKVAHKGRAPSADSRKTGATEKDTKGGAQKGKRAETKDKKKDDKKGTKKDTKKGGAKVDTDNEGKDGKKGKRGASQKTK